mgnify:CR=1 FL=1
MDVLTGDDSLVDDGRGIKDCSSSSLGVEGTFSALAVLTATGTYTCSSLAACSTEAPLELRLAMEEEELHNVIIDGPFFNAKSADATKSSTCSALGV